MTTPSKGPVCAHCKRNPATCIGQYDNMPDEAFACDDCCGHCCEDGWCRPVEAFADPDYHPPAGIEGGGR